MPSIANNNIVRTVRQMSMLESAQAFLTSASDINQGDLCMIDAGVLKPIAVTADAAKFCGVSRVSLVDGKLVSPYPSPVNSEALSDVPGPVYGVIARLVMKTGDAFAPGAKVYLVASEPQQVTSVDPGDGLHIGIYQNKNVASASAGQVGEFLIGSRFGNETSGINF